MSSDIEYTSVTLYPPYDATYGSGKGAEADMCRACGALVGDTYLHKQFHGQGK